MSQGSGTQHLKDEGSRHQVILAGGISGLVSRFVIAPLDVIKIRLQLQIHSLSEPALYTAQNYRPGSGPVYKGTLGTLRAIIQQEGFTALWKGNIPAELLYVAYGGAQFSAYRATTAILRTLPTEERWPDAVENFAAGALAGGAATTVTYPLDLLRTRFAAQGTERIYEGLVASVRDIYQHEGPRGFFQGCTAGLAQILPYMGFFFSFYEGLKIPFSEFGLPGGSSDAFAGVVASVASKTIVFPLDTIRKRLQVQGPTRERYVHRNIPLYQGVVGTLNTIVKREGMRGLYRGLPVSLIKAAPASAVTMWTYERAMNALQKLDTVDENQK